jgi:hypothetical protein
MARGMRQHSQDEKLSCWIVNLSALESYPRLWVWWRKHMENHIRNCGGSVYRHPTRMTLLVEAPKNRIAPRLLSLLDRAEQRTFGERWPSPVEVVSR